MAGSFFTHNGWDFFYEIHIYRETENLWKCPNIPRNSGLGLLLFAKQIVKHFGENVLYSLLLS